MLDNHDKNNMKSPLRYPGGKTRACNILDHILNTYFDLSTIDTLISPFFGGGSFEIYVHRKYGFNVIANDKFNPLYTFWKHCIQNPEELATSITTFGRITKERFLSIRRGILEETDSLIKASMYFILNRCSFSGSTMSGGFSMEASTKRFTPSCIERIRQLQLHRFSISNIDFEPFLDNNYHVNSILFVDPPHHIDHHLYGFNGDLHEDFDHERLYMCLKNHSRWILTYNDCEYIRTLYREYTIIDASWTYGMNRSKKSSEIVILSVKE